MSRTELERVCRAAECSAFTKIIAKMNKNRDSLHDLVTKSLEAPAGSLRLSAMSAQQRRRHVQWHLQSRKVLLEFGFLGTRARGVSYCSDVAWSSRPTGSACPWSAFHSTGRVGTRLYERVSPGACCCGARLGWGHAGEECKSHEHWRFSCGVGWPPSRAAPQIAKAFQHFLCGTHGYGLGRAAGRSEKHRAHAGGVLPDMPGLGLTQTISRCTRSQQLGGLTPPTGAWDLFFTVTEGRRRLDLASSHGHSVA